MTCNSGRHFAVNSELFPVCPPMAFGGKQFQCYMSCDNELANEWTRCSRENANYITTIIKTHLHSFNSNVTEL